MKTFYKMKWNRYIGNLCACMVLIMPAMAQKTYTLDECLEQALRNNVRIKNATNDLRMAQYEQHGTFSKYFPSVSATAGGLIASKGLLEMELQPGMLVSMVDDGVVGGISASLPLFAGRQIVHANRLAKNAVEISKIKMSQSKDEVVLTTEKYFWQVAVLKEKLKTIGKVEKQLESVRKDVEVAVRAGIVNNNDLLQIQLRQNEMESTRLSVENTLWFARNMLAQYIGLGTQAIEITMDTDTLLPPEDVYIKPEMALPANYNYQLLEENVEIMRTQQKMAVGKNLPVIAIGGNYSYENLFDRDHHVGVGFAIISIPISDWWGGSQSIKKQKLNACNAENTLADQSEVLLIGIAHIWNSLQEAYRQIHIAINSIEQATENLRLQTDYYRTGLCTLSDLLDAQTLYQQSHDKYMEAYAQYALKKREYLQATGQEKY